MEKLPKRKPNRLAEYDYSQNGAYFVTICVKDRHEILSVIEPSEHHFVGANFVRPQDDVRPQENRPQLTAAGKIVESEIKKLSVTYDGVSVDCFIIMPNHVHMIIFIHNEIGRTQFAPTVSRIIKQWKGSVTKQIGYSIWQKSFHDHIIRDEEDFYLITEYIQNNPANWEQDCFHPKKEG
ncbi:MAG: Transposase IS200 like protein [Firmicutes bacterium ADurb.Bin262]|nr:MAG: Transposase IS200 like protein [Firmicutes bacterium ADurb.Bin262]